MEPNVCSLDELSNKFYQECKTADLNEILCETRILKEFKHLMVIHAMDSMSESFQSLYYNQEKFLKRIKKEYQVKHGTP